MSFTQKFVAGALVAAALAAAPASAGGRYYGGYPGGYHGYPGGYYGGGYHNNGGDVAAALIGGLLFGGLIGAAATSSKQASVPPPPPPPRGYVQSAYATPAYAAGAPAPVAQAAPDAATAQVELCSRAAERTAQAYGGFARVVAIQGIDGNQANAQVRGTVEVNPGNGLSVTTTAFTCAASYGTVTGVRLG